MTFYTDLHDFGQHGLVEYVLPGGLGEILFIHIVLLVQEEGTPMVILMQELVLPLVLQICDDFGVGAQIVPSLVLRHRMNSVHFLLLTGQPKKIMPI